MAGHRQATTVTFRAVVGFGRNPYCTVLLGRDRTNYGSLFSSAEFRTPIRKGCLSTVEATYL
eukprot:scaffold421292_cov45-Attheya_sp.AAC.1